MVEAARRAWHGTLRRTMVSQTEDVNSGSVSPREGSKIDKKDGKDGQKGGRRGREKREEC